MSEDSRIADLERRVAALERGAVRNGEVPTPPIHWPFIPPSLVPSIGESRCPTCGITLSPVMGYVCSKANCPTGLGGIHCSV